MGGRRRSGGVVVTGGSVPGTTGASGLGRTVRQAETA